MSKHRVVFIALVLLCFSACATQHGSALQKPGSCVDQFVPQTGMGSLTQHWQGQTSHFIVAYSRQQDGLIASLVSLQGVPLYQVRCTDKGLKRLEQTAIATAPSAQLLWEMLSWVFATDATLLQNADPAWQLTLGDKARYGYRAGVLQISVEFKQRSAEQVIAVYRDVPNQRVLEITIEGIPHVVSQ